MIPVYNRTRHLAEALDSVLAQGFDRSKMQIEVIDDCSTEMDVGALVEAQYGDRVSFFRQPRRLGLASNWNACIERAKGELVHILHDDDFVATGYYAEIEALARKHPHVGLYATRNFGVDDDSIITWVSNRVRELERPAKAIEPFLYETSIQCAAVTVRRTTYRSLGGFRLDMGYVTDCEMWARVTASHGAIISPKILAAYRMGNGTETRKVLRTAEAIRDISRLNDLMAQRYAGFSVERGRARVSSMAWQYYEHFKRAGDQEAAAANYEAWKQLTPAGIRSAFTPAPAPAQMRVSFGPFHFRQSGTDNPS
jgi:glycosyltransferase involved in cell wall biosynthesis